VFLRTAPTNESIIMYVLASMVLLAIVLAAIVKLDRVVTSQMGYVVTTAGALYVSPLNSSVVRSLNVKAGQVVKKGQPLATLDPTFTQADLLQMQEHLGSDKAQIDREEAELAKRPYVYSATQLYQSIQGGIWQKRQEQYKQDLSNFDGQINSAQAQMTQALSDAEKYRKRLKLATDEENVYKPLLGKGYVSELQVMQATDARTEISRLLADAENQISQYRETAASLKAQRASYIQKWFSDTATQLVADRNDLDLTQDSLDKDQKLQDLTSLDAPEDAIVLKIGKLSPGSVTAGQGQDAVSPGTDPLFTLTPLNAPVETELDVATTDVGFVAVGAPVTLKLDAYSFIRHGVVRGVVTSVSEGSFSTDINNNPVTPYFKVKAKITQLQLHNVPPDFRLIPGMTLQGDIMVGRRSILSYIVEGALRTGSEAMREPE
jgi:HlyD family type I secretion membrane fusion protein